MSAFLKVKKWLEESKNYSIPPLNENGLCRFVADETLLIHILTNPKTSASTSDSLFIYAPLINIHLLNNAQIEKILWYVAEKNMPAQLTENSSLSCSKQSQHVWLNFRISTNHIELQQFENYLTSFIHSAKQERATLIELMKSQDLNETALASTSALTDDINILLPQNIIWG